MRAPMQTPADNVRATRSAVPTPRFEREPRARRIVVAGTANRQHGILQTVADIFAGVAVIGGFASLLNILSDPLGAIGWCLFIWLVGGVFYSIAHDGLQ